MAKDPKVKISELTPSETEELKKYLKEATVAKIAMSQYKEQLSEVAEVACDALNLQKAEFNKHANIAYESHKANEALEKAEEVYGNAVRLGLIEDDYEG